MAVVVIVVAISVAGRVADAVAALLRCGPVGAAVAAAAAAAAVTAVACHQCRCCRWLRPLAC